MVLNYPLFKMNNILKHPKPTKHEKYKIDCILQDIYGGCKSRDQDE